MNYDVITGKPVKTKTIVNLKTKEVVFTFDPVTGRHWADFSNLEKTDWSEMTKHLRFRMLPAALPIHGRYGWYWKFETKPKRAPEYWGGTSGEVIAFRNGAAISDDDETDEGEGT